MHKFFLKPVFRFHYNPFIVLKIYINYLLNLQIFMKKNKILFILLNDDLFSGDESIDIGGMVTESIFSIFLAQFRHF